MVSIRPGMSRTSPSASAAVSSGIPTSRAEPIAARQFDTLKPPRSVERTSTPSTRKEMPPASTATSDARRSASRSIPKVTTGIAARPIRARPEGSSALRTPRAAWLGVKRAAFASRYVRIVP